MILQSSQRLPELLFYTKKSYKILQLQFQLQFQLQSYTCTVQRILHAEDKELFEYYNSTHRRQGDLLEMHPCVLQDIQGNSSCSRDIQDIPVIHDLPAFQAILQCSSISRESTPFQHCPIRMHIPQFDWFPENSTEYQLGNYRHYKHSFILQRKGDVAISVKLTDYS